MNKLMENTIRNNGSYESDSITNGPDKLKIMAMSRDVIETVVNDGTIGEITENLKK